MKAITGTVSGRVQGVGFRYSTLREALRLGLTGWVANRPDGTVAFRAQGEPADVDLFIEFLHRGPRSARVDSVIARDVAPEDGATSFVIR